MALVTRPARVYIRWYHIVETHRMRSRLTSLTLFFLLLSATAAAGPNDPIEGQEFARLLGAQDTAFQNGLTTLFPDTEGYAILGPLDPEMAESGPAASAYHSVRILCPNWDAFTAGLKVLSRSDSVQWIDSCYLKPCDGRLPGYRGIIAALAWEGSTRILQLSTVQQTRWLIWARKLMRQFRLDLTEGSLASYAQAASAYLSAVDHGDSTATAPRAADFGLPDSVDFYAPPPDYVIAGYQQYKDFLHDHAGIRTEFASGILAFVPTDSLLTTLMADAPQTAYPNKEAPMLQSEYRKFLKRGGDPRIVQTLTRARLDTLAPGEYFFAVGLTGKIRFGRELLREEVRRLEEETGRRVPRANHAFLFPGEPILTAGAFVIGSGQPPRIVEVNAQSGHYFYSNVTATIRDDIAIRSNEYLLTLGHFFRALERLGIPGDGILIRKL